MQEVAIEGRNLSKHFGHVAALTDATVRVGPGEVVALVGDNGAGKSTVLNVLLGIQKPDGGRILIDGVETSFQSVRDSQHQGIECVYQDLSLAPDLSVVENVFLGHELTGRGLLGRIGRLARTEMMAQAEDALQRLGSFVPDLSVRVGDLSGGQRQAVAVARAVMWAKKAVLMDEPTAALGVKQSEMVCELITNVARQGLAVLLVSHDLPRALQVSDRVTILWRGRTVLDASSKDLTVPDVVATMVGYRPESAA